MCAMCAFGEGSPAKLCDRCRPTIQNRHMMRATPSDHFPSVQPSRTPDQISNFKFPLKDTRGVLIMSNADSPPTPTGPEGGACSGSAAAVFSAK